MILGAGVLAGGLGALLGIGGGVFLVPFLHLALGFPLRSAAAISLAGVLAATIMVTVPINKELEGQAPTDYPSDRSQSLVKNWSRAHAVRTTLGARLTAVRPTLAEYILEMPRGAQVIYPKDLGPILMLADIYPGARILESGVGSQPERQL